MKSVGVDIYFWSVVATFTTTWIAGSFYEYAKKGGAHDLKVALHHSYRENERLREELHSAGLALGAAHHPAFEALTPSVTGERPQLSLVQSEGLA